MSNGTTRNQNIYDDYICNSLSYADIANKYELSESTVKTIVSRLNDLFEERANFMSNLYCYLNIYYPKNATRLYKVLYKHLKKYDIYRIDGIIETIKFTPDIEGVGTVYRSILNNYLKYRFLDIEPTKRKRS